MKSRKVSALDKNVKVPVNCDVCGKDFVLSAAAKTLRCKKFSDGIEISYFVCEGCGQKYIYLITDQSLRKLIKMTKMSPSPLNKLYIRQKSDKLRELYADRVAELE